MKTRTKLQTQIFLWYAVIVVVVVAVASLVSVRYITGILVQREEQNTGDLAQLINGQLDMLYDEMAKVSSVVVYNRQVAALLDSLYEDAPAGDEQHQLRQTKDMRDLLNTLVSINGPSPTVHSINVIHPGRNFFAGLVAQTSITGDVTAALPGELLRDIEAADGYYVVLPPHRDYWTIGEAPQVISVMREYRDINGKSYGLVEIQQSAERLERICQSYARSNRDADVLLFDTAGSLIYTSAPTPEPAPQPLAELMDRGRNGQWTDSLLTGGDFYGLSASEATGFLVAVRIPYAAMMRSVGEMRRSFALLAVLLIGITFVFCFLLSRTIANPIRQLSRLMDAAEPSLSGEAALLPAGSPLFANHETARLNQAFGSLLARLRESADELATSRTGELESHFYALQAQINPHFIHNVLANIGALADEQERGEISGICYMLSKMLRYSLSDIRAYSDMKTEFENVETYFKLLQFRHGSKLRYTLELDPALRDLTVPKFILQPLVENSVTYGKSPGEGGWRISVRGVKAGSGWRVDITDEGCGFPPQALDAVNRFVHRLGAGQLSARDIQREISGMGIANVAMRLKVFFGEEIRLTAANSPEGGARITIISESTGRETQ